MLPGLFWGTIAGFTSFVSHSGGPPYQVYTLPLKMKRTVFAGTATIAFAYINAVKLIPYFFLGQTQPREPQDRGRAGDPGRGRGLPRRLAGQGDERKALLRLIFSLLFVLSLKLVWDGLMG